MTRPPVSARAVICTASVRAAACRTVAPRRRRPRHQEAFALPAAAATVAVAAATFAAVLRTLLALRTRRVVAASLLRARRTIAARFPPLPLSQPATAAVAVGVGSEFGPRLDAVAASATADLEAAGPVNYEELSGSERARLLADALRTAAGPTAAPTPSTALKTKLAQPQAKPLTSRLDPCAQWEAAAQYWRNAESLNGRLAAIGFAVCLLRESLEPTHPSMLAQLREVIVPVATKAPPFLVAMVDRIADLLI